MTTLREKMKQEMILRGMAISTQKNYLKVVSKLNKYYKSYPLAKLTGEQIKTYLLHIACKKKISAGFYNAHVQALRFFYRIVLDKPISDRFLPRMRSTVKYPEILSSSEVAQIIKSTFNIKQKTIFILAYGAGLRVSEIAHLKLKNIDSKRMLLHICNSKGGRDRYAVLSPIVLKALRIYWQKYRSKIKSQGGWVFPGRDIHKPISVRTIGYVFTKAKIRAGITKSGGIHSLRHAFATHALDAGINLYTIKELLGHALIKTTSVYLHMTTKQLSEVEVPIEKLNF
jgi:site-specific recombinase XerD